MGGDDNMAITKAIEYKAISKLAANDSLARIAGMFEKDNKQSQQVVVIKVPHIQKAPGSGE